MASEQLPAQSCFQDLSNRLFDHLCDIYEAHDGTSVPGSMGCSSASSASTITQASLSLEMNVSALGRLPPPFASSAGDNWPHRSLASRRQFVSLRAQQDTAYAERDLNTPGAASSEQSRHACGLQGGANA